MPRKTDGDQERERRILNLELAEVRMSGDGGHLVGHAAVFDRNSEELGGFIERIDPKAFEGGLGDVVATFNHDINQLLGRQLSGTLKLSVDDVGLLYEVDLPDTQAGRDVRELVKRGDVRGSSFTFEALDDDWQRSGELRIRTLKKVKVHEVGPVTFPAYPDTSVATRALKNGSADFRDDIEKAAERIKALERRQRVAEILFPLDPD